MKRRGEYDRCDWCHAVVFVDPADGLCADCWCKWDDDGCQYEDHPSFTDAERNEGASFLGPY